MKNKKNKRDVGFALCRFYRTLASVQIDAVDYVRSERKDKESEGDYLQGVAERAMEVTISFENLLEKHNLAIEGYNPRDSASTMMSNKDSGTPSEFQYLMRDDCHDNSLCWDPVTKTCVAC